MSMTNAPLDLNERKAKLDATRDDLAVVLMNEFEYRYNSRKIDDSLRFVGLLGQVQGRVEWFCETPQPQNPYA